MKFVERNHYCKQCDSEVSYINIVTEKNIGKTRKCPKCNGKVISYWKEDPLLHVLPIVLGVPFTGFSFIYALYKLYIGEKNSFDIFILVFNVVLSMIIMVYASTKRNKSDPPTHSDNSQKMLQLYKKQKWTVLFLTMGGYMGVIAINSLFYLIWILFK